MKKVILLLLLMCVATVGVFAQPVAIPNPTATPQPGAVPGSTEVAPIMEGDTATVGETAEEVSSTGETTAEATPTPEPTPMPANGSTVNILFTSDIHGNFLQNAETGSLGYSGIAAIHRSIPNSILADGGDYLTSTMFITEESINEILSLMNATGYHVAGIGEADLENGVEMLTNVQAGANFQMLSTNVTLGTSHQPVLSDHQIYEVNGIKVGFFSILSPDLKLSPSLQNVTDVYLEDAGKTAQKAVNTLKQEGADVIVALSHVGNEGNTNVDQIAAFVNGIDFILDGHDHQEESGRWIGETLILNPGANGQQLIQLELSFNNRREITNIATTQWTYEAISQLPVDPAIAALEQSIAQNQAAFLSDGVALADKEIPYSYSVNYQSEPIGNFIADAYRQKSQATIAIINAGSIEAGLPQGQVSKSDILAVLPNQYTIQMKKITPKELKMALEGCFYNIKLNEDGSVDPASATPDFPQISGFQVQVNYQNEPGKRVMGVRLDNGVELNLTDDFTHISLASSDGAFHEIFDAFQEIEVEEEFGSEGQALLEYLSQPEDADDYTQQRVLSTNQKESYTGIIVSILLILVFVVMILVFVVKLLTKGA